MGNCYLVLHEKIYYGFDLWGIFTDTEGIQEAFLSCSDSTKELLLKDKYEILQYDGDSIVSKQLLSDFLKNS